MPDPSAEPQIAESLLDLIGDTPLVRLRRVTEGLAPTIAAKLEMLNPGGSVKDRPALAMVEQAEREGLLKPGGTIVEPTSGNTGVGLAIVAAQRGYDCIFVVTDKVAPEKVRLLEAYGARVVVCPVAVEPDDPQSYYSVAERLVQETPGAFRPNQYGNPWNPWAHEQSTGPESGPPDGGAPHPLRGRHRHRRHDHRRRPLPQGPRTARAGRGRRPRGLGVLGRVGAAVPGRGHRRGLLARRRTTRRSSTGSWRSATRTAS